MSSITLNDLQLGTEIYYHGDMANEPGFGKIMSTYFNASGSFVDVLMNDGRIFKSLAVTNFSAEYKGTGLTKFVTKEAYNAYREKKMAHLKYALEDINDHAPVDVKFGYIQWPILPDQLPAQKIVIYVDPGHGSHVVYDPKRHNLSPNDCAKILTEIITKEW